MDLFLQIRKGIFVGIRMKYSLHNERKLNEKQAIVLIDLICNL